MESARRRQDTGPGGLITDDAYRVMLEAMLLPLLVHLHTEETASRRSACAGAGYSQSAKIVGKGENGRLSLHQGRGIAFMRIAIFAKTSNGLFQGAREGTSKQTDMHNDRQ